MALHRKPKTFSLSGESRADIIRHLNNVYRGHSLSAYFAKLSTRQLDAIKRNGSLTTEEGKTIYAQEFDENYKPARGRPVGALNKTPRLTGEDFMRRFASLQRNAALFPNSRKYDVYRFVDKSWKKQNSTLYTAQEAWDYLFREHSTYGIPAEYLRYQFINTEDGLPEPEPEPEHEEKTEHGTEIGISEEEIKNILREEIPALLKAHALAAVEEINSAKDKAIREIPRKVRVEIETPKRKIILPEDEIEHRRYPLVLALVEKNVNVLLVGPAGTGKSEIPLRIADKLDRIAYPMSVGNQTSKGDILGFIHAGGDYITSAAREAYENSGSILICDEFDAGNANALTLMNQMLANKITGFPDAPEGIKKGKNSCVVATANTYGTGGNRLYARNQLDAATLDRFFVLQIDYDNALESYICGIPTNQVYELPQPSNLTPENILQITQEVRTVIERRNIPHIVSMRASIMGVKLCEIMPKNILLDGIIWRGMTPSVKEQIIAELSESTRGLIQ